MADPISKDATGYELITSAIKDYLNNFPALLEDEAILYEELEEDSGICFSNNTGALVYSESVSVTGKVHQKCQYPFLVVYRASASARERQKISIQNFLDQLGKWACLEPVEINGVKYEQPSYPSLTDGRIIKKITRDNAYASAPQESGIQDWVLPITVDYENEFYRK